LKTSEASEGHPSKSLCYSRAYIGYGLDNTGEREGISRAVRDITDI